MASLWFVAKISAPSLSSKTVHKIKDLILSGKLNQQAISIARPRRTIKYLMLWLRAEYSNSKVLSKISVWIFNFQKTGVPPTVIINPVRDFALLAFASGFLL